MTKLNLGCGLRKLDGWVNVDIADADVTCDITLPLPFADESVDVVMAIHVLEHFYVWDAKTILDQWLRVLKPGGVLILELPCLDKIVMMMLEQVTNEGAVDFDLTMMGLYGNPGLQDPYMMHKWCYSAEWMDKLMSKLDVTKYRLEEPKFHKPERDMRWVAWK